ncbi:coenzyme F420-0:L-glutamate ligase [Patescibacteria group bacterium]|nr:coenzyme F420-0:L-glutamate ligase [Patescibacteria group bacterium]
MAAMEIRPIRTRIYEEGEDLAEFVAAHVKKLPEGAVLAVTSKIVALGEGRTAPFGDEASKARLIRSESEWLTRTKYVWLTLSGGLLTANAGVDESNADGKLILLPKDSFAAAAKLRRALMKKHGVKKLGVVITDSRTTPLRAGTTGVALGYAGFKGLKDYRGTKDLFGRAFHFSKVSVADSLASAAALAMGEGAERQPLALITDAPVEFTERVKKGELVIPPEDDMYGPFLAPLLPKHR